MKMYYSTVTDTAGNIINGATVTVYEDGGAVASIYDYLGSPISNPFLSGLNRSEGEVEFAAESGVYDIKIVNGLETDWIRNEVLFDPEEPGEIGATTPAKLTCTEFTSNGIDDNASETRIVIGNSKTEIGTSGSAYGLTHSANNQYIYTSGGNSTGVGGEIRAYGGAHATKAGDIEILSGGNILAHWDEDNGELIISAGTGAKTEAIRVYSGGVIKCASDAIITGDAISADNTSSLGLFGGNAANTGGGIIGYGGAHATLPGDVYLVSGANPFLSWDESDGSLTLSTGVGAKTSAITIPSTQVVTFSQIPKVGSDDILIDSDVGVNVQGYSAYTALYNDTTANFTGTLQNGGSNVLVDSDLGGSVQPYDADTAKTDVANTWTANQTLTTPAATSSLTLNAASGQNADISLKENGIQALLIRNSASANASYLFKYDAAGSGSSYLQWDENGDLDFVPGAASSGLLKYNGNEVLSTADIGSTVQGHDADTAKLDVAANFTAGLSSTNGALAVGVNDVTSGNILIYGGGPGGADGGQITMFTTADYDTNVEFFYIDVLQESLRINGSSPILTANETTNNIDLATGGSYTVTINNVDVATKRPFTDDTDDFGTLTYRWQDIYATNGTIQTSDERLKDNITDVNPTAAEALISALRPRSFKWKDYDQDIYSTPEDGSDPVLVDTIHHTYTRTHYGLIAQEFEQALISIGINPDDMAGFIHDQASDRYGVRYNELISPMLSVIQSLMAKNTALEARVTAAEARLDALEAI